MINQNSNTNFLKLGILSLKNYMSEEGHSEEQRKILNLEIFDYLYALFLNSIDFMIRVKFLIDFAYDKNQFTILIS